MRRTTNAVLASAAAAALAVTGLSAGTASADQPRHGLRAVGLTDDGNQLVRFHTADPRSASAPKDVTGLAGDGALVGIDYRVQDGRLYGVGDEGGLYRLWPATGRAAKVGQLTVALEGERFGVDFNPAANALRIVSDTGQNLRQSLATVPLAATVVDTPLSYPPALPPATGIAAAAYTNNDLATTTGTSLFDLDTDLDQVALQAPANSGQLSPTGSVNRDVRGDAGLDIYSTLSGGATQKNQAFATFSKGGTSRLYTVSLLTGDTTMVGRFPASADVVDLAIRLDQ